MSRLSIKAAIVGGLVNVVATFLAKLVVSIVLTGTMLASLASTLSQSAAPGATRTPHGAGSAMIPTLAMQTHAAAPMLVLSHGLFLAIDFVVGTAAGYLAGRIAGHDRVLNGAASSGLGILIALGMFLLVPHQNPSMRSLATTYVLWPLVGAFGGYLSTLGRVDVPADVPAPAE
jgi:hypothetical protein